MNRIETRIVVAVTNRLAAAADSAAKEEMIEELSENLYQRYLELSGSGMPEEEAFREAMESLGDVEELLAYLKEENGGGQSGGVQDDIPKPFCKTAFDGGQGTQEAEAGKEADGSAREEETADNTQDWEASADSDGASGRKNNWESGIEELVNAAIYAAKTAVDCAGDMVKGASDQVKRKYPDGVFYSFNTEAERKVDSTELTAQGVEALDIHLTNGDIRIFGTDGEEITVNVSGDTDEIETVIKEDGVLSIRQLNTASAHFFFVRGMRRSDVEVRLPKKVWDEINVATTNGDVEITDFLECREMNLSTVNGDVKAAGVSGELFQIRSVSGDIEIGQVSGNLRAETKSGDIEVNGSAEHCELSSISGDVRFCGESREIAINATSGDLELELGNLPETAKVGTKSGDCKVKLPAGKGFRLSYRTVSGDFSTNLPLTGNLGAKSGEVTCGDPVCGHLQISSISGDIRIRGL